MFHSWREANKKKQGAQLRRLSTLKANWEQLRIRHSRAEFPLRPRLLERKHCNKNVCLFAQPTAYVNFRNSTQIFSSQIWTLFACYSLVLTALVPEAPHWSHLWRSLNSSRPRGSLLESPMRKRLTALAPEAPYWSHLWRSLNSSRPRGSTLESPMKKS
jgi:hypothetical protein